MQTYLVANHLLRIGFREKVDDLTPIRLQKLLYLTHGWYLAITGQPLVDEPFRKGTYGPLLIEIAERLQPYGSGPVNDYIPGLDLKTFEVQTLSQELLADKQFNEILEKVWNVYNRFTTEQLSVLCRGKGSPWEQTAPRLSIPNELIRENFLAQVKRNRAQRLDRVPT